MKKSSRELIYESNRIIIKEKKNLLTKLMDLEEYHTDADLLKFIATLRRELDELVCITSLMSHNFLAH